METEENNKDINKSDKLYNKKDFINYLRDIFACVRREKKDYIIFKKINSLFLSQVDLTTDQKKILDCVNITNHVISFINNKNKTNIIVTINRIYMVYNYGGIFLENHLQKKISSQKKKLEYLKLEEQNREIQSKNNMINKKRKNIERESRYDQRTDKKEIFSEENVNIENDLCNYFERLSCSKRQSF